MTKSDLIRSGTREQVGDENRAEHSGLGNSVAVAGVAGVAPRSFAPFPVGVLPEPIRRFVADAAESIGCDPSYVALPMLSGLASAIGNTYRIVLKPGWAEPAIVWTAIVGESGSMKSPAFKLAMKFVRRAQDLAFNEYKLAAAEWEAVSLGYEAKLADWKRRAAKSPEAAGDPPEKPTPPVARRYIVSDTTTEALAPILQGNPRGVLLARDELAGWLGSFDRYAKSGRGGADSAHWLSMHTGESLTIDRKTGIPPTIHVPSASVCIAGGIQPGILARAMGREHHESGMLARLLFAMPPRRAKRWSEATVDPTTEAAVETVFARLFDLAPYTDAAGEESPYSVRLTESAKAAWIKFYDAHAREHAELSGDEAAAWSKLEGYAARLALVIHLTRWAAHDATMRDSERVDESSVEAGVVLARWFGEEARRVYSILDESDDDRDTRRLVEWIERQGGSVTVRDLTRGPQQYRRSPERAAKALGELVAAGVGRWEVDDHAGGRGRPSERFRLLSRGGDTGDGDENPGNSGDRRNSVAVANVANVAEAGSGAGARESDAQARVGADSRSVNADTPEPVPAPDPSAPRAGTGNVATKAEPSPAQGAEAGRSGNVSTAARGPANSGTPAVLGGGGASDTPRDEWPDGSPIIPPSDLGVDEVDPW